jgi:two-component system, OmpR family, alkaline phosphatase synthesis response regulator PhoP
VKNSRILLVEDEPNIARGLLFNLEAEGCRVVHAGDGETALRLIGGEEFSLVILDLTLPGMDGLEVCRHLRSVDARLPILILTARSDERDRVEGLACGADDYLTKPFHLQEFLLRVEGILRRSRWYRPSADESERYRFGSNEVDLVGQRAWTRRQGEIALTDLEVRMLRLFLQREGETVSRADLLASVWGFAPDTETRTLDNFIVRLRKYFEENPAEPVFFITVRGRGYRFDSKGGRK